jgi:hypothetical protein
VSDLERPIFVVGCPRSGTTLVQCILSASSGAFSLPETHFFSDVLPLLGGDPYATLGATGMHHARQLLESDAELGLPDTFWTALEGQQRPIALDIFLSIVQYFRPTADLRAIEKTPRHVLHLDLIGRVFPDAVFVNVVRDPIDVASSLQGVPFIPSRSMLSHAERWLESVQAAQRYSFSHPGRLYDVVYERLVREPEVQTRALCTAVDLAFEPKMLEEFGRETARNVHRGEAWKEDVSRGVIVDRQGVWRARMTPGQAWLVAQSTSGTRRCYGYLDAPSAPAPSIAAAMVREAGVRFDEARLGSAGMVGAARHAASVLKTLAAT